LIFFSLISILISLAVVSSYVNYRSVKLPTTVGVMLVTLVALIALVLIWPYTGGFREQAAAPISLCVDDKVDEFVSGTTCVFELSFKEPPASPEVS
jgi:CPA1 family monovalent cation:H+ antiporter